jgi:hypothetical protein
VTRTDHRLLSAVLELRAIPEVDGARMMSEWKGGGPVFYRDVEREIYVLSCSCGEQGMAYTHNDIPAVFNGHLERVPA